MNKTKRSTVILQDWMYDLCLRLPEIIAYAIIFGFSQDGESDFHGGRTYLCRKLCCTKHTVDAVLRTLEDRGLIRRKDAVIIKGKEFNTYVAILPEDAQPVQPTAEEVLIPAPAPAQAVEAKPAPAKFDFRRELLGLGVSAETVDAWLQVRKAKKMVNTKLAFDAVVREVNNADVSAEECIRLAVEKSWGGFRAEWLQNAAQSAYHPAGGSATRPAPEKPRRGGVMASEEINAAAMEAYRNIVNS